MAVDINKSKGRIVDLGTTCGLSIPNHLRVHSDCVKLTAMFFILATRYPIINSSPNPSSKG
jgi:hypothetical protein